MSRYSIQIFDVTRAAFFAVPSTLSSYEAGSFPYRCGAGNACESTIAVTLMIPAAQETRVGLVVVREGA